MGGGLMQLVAYGAQDIYLTGNPQITFFKVVYRRHTNFSMETIKQTITGASEIKKSSNKGTVTISRNGDLLHDIYFVVNVENHTNGKGLDFISDVEIEIGGQLIDKHTGDWMKTWLMLTTPSSKRNGLNAMLSQSDTYTQKRDKTNDVRNLSSIQVPLQFWFCRNPGLALPLIALQYHEVKMHINFIDKNGGLKNDESNPCFVHCDYIYLDTDERRRFAQVSHEYLIEQIQIINHNCDLSAREEKKINIDLNFNHPVKELIWNYGGTYFDDVSLILNGHERFSPMKEEYFTLRQPYKYHTHVPESNLYNYENIQGSTLEVPIVTNASAGENFDKSLGPITDAVEIDSSIDSSSQSTIISATSPPGFDIQHLFTLLNGNMWGEDGIPHDRIIIFAINSDGKNILTRWSDYFSPTGMGGLQDYYITQNYGSDIIPDHSKTIFLPKRYDNENFEVKLNSISPGDEVHLKTDHDGNNPQHISSDDNTASDLANKTIIYTIHSIVDVYQTANDQSNNMGKLFNLVPKTLTGLTGSHADNILKMEFHRVLIYINPKDSLDKDFDKHISVYSFALKPEEHQPSGTCNFSRIDSAKLTGKYRYGIGNNSGKTITIYAVNYNVLRIMSGMGGLAYSN